jgi:hypothetical protein
MRLQAMVVLCAVLALSVAAMATAGGNSGNAKLCQKNGWKTVLGSDGTTFNSEEECVSFAARGGMLVTGTGTVAAIVAVNTVDGTGVSPQGFSFTMNGQAFSLTDNTAGPTGSAPQSFSVLGGFTLQADLTPSGWMLADVSCTTDVGASAQTSLASRNATGTVSVGGHATCTFTYSQLRPG